MKVTIAATGARILDAHSAILALRAGMSAVTARHEPASDQGLLKSFNN
jgi:hypothetical protein